MGLIRHVEEFAPAFWVDVAFDDFAGAGWAELGADVAGEAVFGGRLVFHVVLGRFGLCLRATARARGGGECQQRQQFAACHKAFRLVQASGLASLKRRLVMPCIDTGHISLFVAEAGGGGVPVVLLHELGGSSESWREVMPLMAATRRTIAVDMRGAGRSEKPPGRFDLADVADDLEGLLRALEIAGPVDVVGAALGSLVGALLAIRHPERVRRLMMCAVAADMAGPTRAYVAERAEKVRVAGMRGVAEVSLANSFPDS